MERSGTASLSRRAMLGAAIGAAAGALGAALGRPAPAKALNGDAVILGASNSEIGRTSIRQEDFSTTEMVLALFNAGIGPGLTSGSQGGHGAVLMGNGSGTVGAWGQGFGDGVGVYGFSTNDNEPARPSPEGETGVFGYASQHTSSRGVYGVSSIGIGVRGETESTSGVGGLFVAPNRGRALAVYGRPWFSESGLAYVPAGRSYVDIAPPGGLVSASKILATIQGYRPGVAVSSVRAHYPSSSKARIYVTKAVSSRTAVAWWVFG